MDDRDPPNLLALERKGGRELVLPLLETMRGTRRWLALAIVLTMARILIQLGGAVALGMLVQKGLLEHDVDRAVKAATLVIASSVFGALIGWCTQRALLRASVRTAKNVRRKM